MFDTLSDKFIDAFRHVRGKSKISEENIEETLKDVRTALLEADVNFKVVKEFVNVVKEKALGEKVARGVNPGEQFVKIMHDELAHMMGEANEEINLNRPPVIPILVVGLNGQGKTTFSGKLARHLMEKKKKSILLVPADTFRPAAKDQLITLAKSIGVEWFDSDLKMHPKDIALRALEEAAKLHKDIVIIDTAGRLHVDADLMEQIKEVKQAIAALNPEVLLVADAMTGQEAVNVAKSFHEAITLTGVVLSKMDSDARGGAALSLKYVTGVPIRYISTGEKMQDLELFHPDRLAKRILDMGDVLSLVEKAEGMMEEKEALRMMKNMERGKFTVDDFLKQMNMISNLGSMGSILKMLPGMGQVMKQVGDLSPAENEMKKMKVIISSMTKKEREDYKIMKESHIKRVASGSGTSIQSVQDFLAKFRQMEKMMGSMMSMFKGGMPGFPGMGDGGMPEMGARKGFRQAPSMPGPKKSGTGKRGPWGKGYF
ncbi:MAG: signal recognition particle protein [Bdellovibrionales bacterium RIFOXYD12_FULL_39_22]|nr:MAG: signal recognition particle protein [Bdellovibrionales bacterium RIFOXYB1_FULL_39_21]OFZ41689.1 MAG: signal recognition particle protein [Bdellovibrionales bacterium RIFOXYC12_FULL_39_17]OFZ46089.1 MAG: signal recognition particle protein [Bdellovibrionales bacterium RIFOXYC1_FULL_39_130]OFZ74916.1 MAG: signal recognition particle protein [Bdellovibrionales bacterium RIFOXYD1_FULL_39_84]OFZ92769.1 MAG: signal recognition particle protein [Bdellovibrionales bacterium RIFOXYD12_FULL_39_22